MNVNAKEMGAEEWAQNIVDYVVAYCRHYDIPDHDFVGLVALMLIGRNSDEFIRGAVGKAHWKPFADAFPDLDALSGRKPSESEVVDALRALSLVLVMIGNSSVLLFVIRFPDTINDTSDEWITWRLGPDYVDIVADMQDANAAAMDALHKARRR